MNFEFNAERHIYLIDGARVAGVTNTIKGVGLIDDRFFTDESRERGSAVHLACLYLVHNDLDWESVHPAILGYVQCAAEFLATSGFKPDLRFCEKPMFHPILRYGGTPDWLGWLNGRYVLIDIKSGIVGLSAKVQTAAYANLPELAALFPARFALRLFPDGKRAKLTPEFTDHDDFSVFVSALNIENYKLRHAA